MARARSAREPHPITHLSFVRDETPNRKDNKGRSFWNVRETGDYVDDCILGNAKAREALAYMRATDFCRCWAGSPATRSRAASSKASKSTSGRRSPKRSINEHGPLGHDALRLDAAT